MNSHFEKKRRPLRITILFIAIPSLMLSLMASEIKAASPGRLPSLRGLEIQIGGEFELEIVDSQSDSTVIKDRNGKTLGGTNNTDPRMSIDKIVITPRIYLDTGIQLQADIEFGPGTSKIDEAWIKIPDLPFNSWIKLGLEDVFMKPHRKTESYPLLGHAFWQDEDLGVFIGGEQNEFYWRASATNGRRLKDRKIAENNVFPIPTDDDDNVEANSNKQIGIGLGIDHRIEKDHYIDLLPFYYTSELSPADITYLNTIKNYTGGIQDDQSRYGINLDYRLRGFSFFGQYMMGEDGGMNRDGWYVQPAYKLKLGMTLLKSIEFLLRYEEYNVDLTKDPTDSRTWDRQTSTVAVIAEIVSGFKVKTEYYVNDEKTGASKVDNDELLIQFETKF
ncbi:hypothetical protein JYT87_02720 [Nitrospira defluvii]|nr:hypothetical protein [Nitrospira defluvii]